MPYGLDCKYQIFHLSVCCNTHFLCSHSMTYASLQAINEFATFLCCSSNILKRPIEHHFIKFRRWHTSLFHLPYSTPRFAKCTFTRKLLPFFLGPQSVHSKLHIKCLGNTNTTCVLLCSLPDATFPFRSSTWICETPLEKIALSSFSSKLRASGNKGLPFISESYSTAYHHS